MKKNISSGSEKTPEEHIPNFLHIHNNNNEKDCLKTWPEDADYLLENIRCNSIILSDFHKRQYFVLQSQLKYFRIPIIIISAFASVLNIGLQPYLDQNYISVLCCMLSLVTGLIGSIELFLQIQKKMENELMNSRDFYLNAIDIYKVLSLEPEHRNGDGLKYLDGKFAMYCKMIENSNIMDKAIQDQLAPIDVSMIEKITSSVSNNGDIPSLLSRKNNTSTVNSELNAVKVPRNTIYKNMASKQIDNSRSSIWIENFLPYFFNRSSAIDIREPKKKYSLDNTMFHTLDNPNPNTDSSITHEQLHLDMDKYSDMDSVKSEERFDIYCKIVQNSDVIDMDLIEKITQIMSNHNTINHTIIPLDERIKIYCRLLEHLDVIGGKDIMDRIKIVLVSDFFKKKSNFEHVNLESQMETFKSLMVFKEALDASTLDKIKRLMMKKMKKQSSKVSENIKDEIIDNLLSVSEKSNKPTLSSMPDIETGERAENLHRNSLNLVPLSSSISNIWSGQKATKNVSNLTNNLVGDLRTPEKLRENPPPYVPTFPSKQEKRNTVYYESTENNPTHSVSEPIIHPTVLVDTTTSHNTEETSQDKGLFVQGQL